jgi:salicylate hydroxylase
MDARGLEMAFQAFDVVRRPRSQWLVQSSRRAADVYEGRNPQLGTDWDAIKKDILERQAIIWEADIHKMVSDGISELLARSKSCDATASQQT